MLAKPLKNKNILFHGLSEDRFSHALADGFLKPYTSHRIHKILPIVWRKDAEYDNCQYHFGWSMTRNIDVAKRFGGAPIILAFDKDKISHNFKISPVDWNAQRSPDMRLENEQEEFVFSGGVVESTNYFKKKAEKLLELMESPNLSNQEENAYYEEYEKCLEYKSLYRIPQGKNLSLRYLVGFYLEEELKDLYWNITFLENHELFLGYV